MDNFFELVKNMRILQQKFQRARSPMARRELRGFEREVDRLIKARVEEQKRLAKSEELFDSVR